MSRLVVTDTSCLIALDAVARLEILPRLYDEVVAPGAVVAEFGRRPDWLREEAVDDRDAVRARTAFISGYWSAVSHVALTSSLNYVY